MSQLFITLGMEHIIQKFLHDLKMFILVQKKSTSYIDIVSVQAQDRYPPRTATDQRDEQTFNKDAKTAGGIHDATNEDLVKRFSLGRYLIYSFY